MKIQTKVLTKYSNCTGGFVGFEPNMVSERNIFHLLGGGWEIPYISIGGVAFVGMSLFRQKISFLVSFLVRSQININFGLSCLRITF